MFFAFYDLDTRCDSSTFVNCLKMRHSSVNVLLYYDNGGYTIGVFLEKYIWLDHWLNNHEVTISHCDIEDTLCDVMLLLL